MGSGLLPIFQADQIVPSILVSIKSVYNNFLNHKMFLKTEKQNLCGNYFALCLYNRFKCYNLACVAFEYCASAFKVRSFEM